MVTIFNLSEVTGDIFYLTSSGLHEFPIFINDNKLLIFSGEIHGTLHRKVLEDFHTELAPGAGLILKHVSMVLHLYIYILLTKREGRTGRILA